MIEQRMPSETLDAPGPAGILRVEFLKRGDRYGHIISLIDASGAAIPLLESIEGTATDDWPASPPLQTLSIEELSPNGKVALLVGMAGSSHWSASIEPASQAAELAFDIACRHAKEPRRLSSCYRRLSPRANVRLGALECRDANIFDSGKIIEIMPLFLMSTGTSRWRFAVDAKD